MKWVAFSQDGRPGVGVLRDGAVHGRLCTDPLFGGDLDDLIRQGRPDWCEATACADAPYFALDAIQFRPPFARPNKIVCVGLNYRDHTDEAGYQQPDYPTLFARFNTSLVAHEDPIVRPRVSSALDFE
ncbi:MAG TPA: fumarylacetoacetate hydrolase family protein, partial [Chloroflexota bacterium]|nr:fumarylacetoacetate hydrolase family protein [Chloroflexota bacterium]